MAYKLKSKIKKAWIKALRSGEYKQCRNKLKDGESYCCLGVLNDSGKFTFDQLADLIEEQM